MAPNKDAFAVYDDILRAVCDMHERDQLVLIALGPTATILAADLSRKGIQALDVGHMDIEYEWFLRKVHSRVQISNKFVNEQFGNNEVMSCDDVSYKKQILMNVSYEQ